MENVMGLLDVLNGMANGPRGQAEPGKGGMSPITMALLGLLAYKAYQKVSAPQPGAAPAGNAPDTGGGGLGGLLGGLGGLLAGAGGGAAMTGGLNDLLQKFEQNGLGDVAKSWVGSGDNMPISPDALRKSIGDGTLNTLSQQTGLSLPDLLNTLSQQLPGAINHITPDGRVPHDHEMSKML
jgi:uncharacterized protein YidB (DUF937 family)